MSATTTAIQQWLDSTYDRLATEAERRYRETGGAYALLVYADLGEDGICRNLRVSGEDEGEILCNVPRHIPYEHFNALIRESLARQPIIPPELFA